MLSPVFQPKCKVDQSYCKNHVQFQLIRQFQTDCQTGSYSAMRSEKFSNPAKSGYNKGTIRSDTRYLVVSKDVRRHRLISISYISQWRCHCNILASSSTFRRYVLCRPVTATSQNPRR